MNTNRLKGSITSASLVMILFTNMGVINAGGLVLTDEAAFSNSVFTDSEQITNAWWTLPAESNFLYYAETDDGCAWNLVEVLPLTTDNFAGIYAGTDARIVLDREWLDEACIYHDFNDVHTNIDPEEVTYDWYAQDVALNIWYMGEDTWDGESNEGSFVAGCDGAQAGIVMLGYPTNGDFYQQEFYEDEAEDWGKVLNFKSDEALVCMKTKEWTPLERGEIEHKFYCSNGLSGELTMIKELKGKTVIVDLIATDISPTPAMPASPPSPYPDCE